MKKIKLNLGCGVLFKAGWINVDKFINAEEMREGIKNKTYAYQNAIWEKGAEYVQADILKMPFPDNYADHVLMDNIIEHVKMRLVIPTMKEVYRVMKKGATLKLIAPCFDGLARDWIEFAMSTESSFNGFDYEQFLNIAEPIYGNQAGEEGEGETHRCPFNPGFMNFVLIASGFTEGSIRVVKKHVKFPSELTGSVTGAGKEKTAVTRNEILIVDAKK